MNIISYTIDFALSSIKGHLYIFPFSVVMQTQSLKIERYCKQTWPKLMTHEQYTPEDNLAQYKMIKYIKDSLTSSDLKDIHKIIYDRGWIVPLDFLDNISELALTEYRCKTWSNPTIPYLELKGTITVDLKKILSQYIKKQWITFESKSGLMTEKPVIRFMKTIPFLFVQTGSQKPYEILLKEIQDQANNANSEITKFLKAKTKLKDIHSYKKEILWGYDKSFLTIELKEKIRLLKDKSLANPVKYGLIGLGIHELIKDKPQKATVSQGFLNYLFKK